MKNISDFIQNLLGLNPETQEKLFSSVIVIIGWFILDKLLKKFVFEKVDNDWKIAGYMFNKTSSQK